MSFSVYFCRALPGKQVSDLKLNSSQLHLGLDLAVRVVDDGEEHVEEDEEDDEDVEDEEDRPDDGMGRLERWKVEVSEHCPHQRVGGVGHLREVVELGTEEEVAELCISHEHDHEHEAKGYDIRSAPEKKVFTNIFSVWPTWRWSWRAVAWCG